MGRFSPGLRELSVEDICVKGSLGTPTLAKQSGLRVHLIQGANERFGHPFGFHNFHANVALPSLQMRLIVHVLRHLCTA